LGPILTITSPDQITRPIDSYLPGEQELVSLTLAYYAVANDCLEAQGLAGIAVPSIIPGDLVVNIHADVVERKMLTTLYGDFDPEGVVENGYELGDSVGRGTLMQSQLGPPESMDVAYKCWNALWAVDVSQGGLVMGFLGLGQMPDEGPVANLDDSRMVTVNAQWSACMHDQGFDYPNPREAYLDPQWNLPGTRPLETATAVADMDCKLTTNLVGIAVAVQSAYDQAYIDSHRDALATWKQQLNDILEGKLTVSV